VVPVPVPIGPGLPPLPMPISPSTPGPSDEQSSALSIQRWATSSPRLWKIISMWRRKKSEQPLNQMCRPRQYPPNKSRSSFSLCKWHVAVPTSPRNSRQARIRTILKQPNVQERRISSRPGIDHLDGLRQSQNQRLNRQSRSPKLDQVEIQYPLEIHRVRRALSTIIVPGNCHLSERHVWTH
jgi:hypothetical protein